MNHKKDRGIFTYILVILISIFCIYFIVSNFIKNNTIEEYTDVIKYFDNYQVSYYELDLNTGKLNYQLRDDDNIHTYIVPNISIFLEDTGNYRKIYNEKYPDAPLIQNYIRINNKTLIYSLMPVLITIIFGFFIIYFIMRQIRGNIKYSSFGKANMKNAMMNELKVTFEDIAGVDEEKQELAEIVDYMKNPIKYTQIGAKIPKGILLVGPPGTGKTLLARAVAGEAKCSFFSISGSDFVEMFVGVGASRVRDLFNIAKKNAPSIIFIDEIDAVGRHRGAGLGGSHDEREQTLNQLLVEMDGFCGSENVIVLAATNRRDILDPALLRPGRFDRQVAVLCPDVKGREEILKIYSKGKPLDSDVNLKIIAKTTQGFTGADLKNLLNEAALLAARNNRKSIINCDIEEATLKVIAGPEIKSRIVTEHDKQITAYHEAGHAIVAYNLPTQDKVHQITIIQRGLAAGLTITLPDHNNNYISRNQMRDHIVMLLGGRVSEEIFLDDICTGALNDMERATKTARDMITKYGFSCKIGTVVYDYSNINEVFIGKNYGHDKNYSEAMAAQIDEEIKSVIDKAYSDCYEIIRNNADKVKLIANYLIQNEKINGTDFEKLMNNEKLNNKSSVT